MEISLLGFLAIVRPAIRKQFKPWLCHLPAVWPWEGHSISLSLSCLTCEMELTVVGWME